MEINTPMNAPYKGHIVGHRLIEKIPLKLYFADIQGRDSPENYEWASSGISQDNVSLGIENCVEATTPSRIGIPHIAVAFPHVTTLFRFGDPREPKERETNLYKIGSATTKEEANMTLRDPHFPYENSCPLEAVVLDEEMKSWARSGSVDEYLSLWIPNGPVIEVAAPNKLRAYLEKNPQ